MAYCIVLINKNYKLTHTYKVYKLFNNTSIFISDLELSKASFKRKHTFTDKSFWLPCMCLVGPGLFIMGSWESHLMALFDTTEMKLVAHLDLQHDEEPWDVCLIPGDKVAVTYRWSNTIVIVSVKDNHLHREHGIHIGCRSACITSYKDDLFVVTRNVRTAQVSISRVTLTGDRHLVCDLPERWTCDDPWMYSMTTSKESEPKIYLAYRDNHEVLEVSLDGSKLRSISMPHTESDISIMNAVSVRENILCLFSKGKKLILADINSKKTSVIMKQKTANRWIVASVCPLTKNLLILDQRKHKIKVFKWKWSITIKFECETCEETLC